MEMIPITETPDECIKKTNDNHLESFSLIWLNNNKNVDIQRELRSIINHIETFHDVEECKNYIDKTSENDRLVLVTNGEFGQQIIPSIHQLRQISSIYINSEDKQWTNDTPKIKGIHAEMDELVSQIYEDHKNSRKIEEPVWMNMFTTISDAGKSTTGINGQFAFSQLLLDCLLRLQSNENDRNELISYCEKEYEGNQNELNHLHEFQRSYSSDNVLWWYTRESFFYKTLNAALRKENIHMIYLYRSFIIDIQNQLENHQCQCATRVYRSQLMSIDELNYLKNSVGQYVSVNSILSTSFEKEIAIFRLGDTKHQWDGIEKVLFEIDADPKVGTTKPFADISEFSDFIDESEVLFMLGSIFRLNSITRDNQNSFWIIQMCLCSDDEHDLKQILIDMKNEIGNGETNLCILGKVVRRMGYLDLAKKYYYRCLDELSQNDPLVLTVYKDLAKIAAQQQDYEENVRLRHIIAKINMFTRISDTEKSTTGIIGQFAFFQLLLDCLLQLQSNENDRNELISYCEKECKGNQNELNHLHKFQSGYSPDNALWWYTRESFFYKTLNAALRKQNIHMIYLYRSFIIDIQNQLQNHQCQCATRVYRCQLISIDELNYLKNSVGQYVSVNSFLSTSSLKEISNFYLGDTSRRSIDFEKVLFEIDADPKVVTTKPFADISQFSDFIDESEVLFMPGSIFRLNSVIRDDQNQVWIIGMCLCSDDEHDLKHILVDMKNEIGNGETNLCILGKVVRRMGHFDLAKKYYYRCLDELSQNDPLVLTVYKDLAEIASQQKDYEEYLRLRHIIAKIKEKIQLNGNEIEISEIDKLTDNDTIQKRKPKNSIRCNWHLTLLICSFILILMIGTGIFTLRLMITKNLPTSSEERTLTCTDGIKNQDETDVDCGGEICTKKCLPQQGYHTFEDNFNQDGMVDMSKWKFDVIPESRTYGNIIWPDNGAIYLMAHLGHDRTKISASIVTKLSNPLWNSTKVSDATTKHHVYTLKWTPDMMEMFVGPNEKEALKTRILFLEKKNKDWTQWPFDKPYRLYMKLAVGGNA
ncbi:unnamed protein product [Adineta steineri]|uniref:Uncharacterized protein n=1 Tax=Adineta steineri TaxID=433720 RepID=A0A814W016_9BILA|nr:unnamed protein product [Adineta steineri]